jgi:hypothetical protein
MNSTPFVTFTIGVIKNYVGQQYTSNMSATIYTYTSYKEQQPLKSLAFNFQQLNKQALDVAAIVVLIHYQHYTAISKLTHILVFFMELKTHICYNVL